VGGPRARDEQHSIARHMQVRACIRLLRERGLLGLYGPTGHWLLQYVQQLVSGHWQVPGFPNENSTIQQALPRSQKDQRRHALR
jgi:hypothetical protein